MHVTAAVPVYTVIHDVHSVLHAAHCQPLAMSPDRSLPLYLKIKCVINWLPLAPLLLGCLHPIPIGTHQSSITMPVLSTVITTVYVVIHIVHHSLLTITSYFRHIIYIILTYLQEFLYLRKLAYEAFFPLFTPLSLRSLRFFLVMNIEASAALVTA